GPSRGRRRLRRSSRPPRPGGVLNCGSSRGVRGGRRGRGGAVVAADYAAQSIHETGDVEIHQEPYFAVRESQVCVQLGCVDGGQLLDRLDLDDDTALDEEVDAEGTLEFDAHEVRLQRLLTLHLE